MLSLGVKNSTIDTAHTQAGVARAKSRMLLVFLGLLVALVCMIVVSVWSSFKQAKLQNQQRLMFQSQLLERSVTRTFESVESGIISLELLINQRHANAKDDEQWRDTLKQRMNEMLQFAPYIRQILITYGDRIVVDSTGRSENQYVDTEQLPLDMRYRLDNASHRLKLLASVKGRFFPVRGQAAQSSRQSILITGQPLWSEAESEQPYWVLIALNPEYVKDFVQMISGEVNMAQDISLIGFDDTLLVSSLDASTERPSAKSFLESGHKAQLYSDDSALHAWTLSLRYPLIISITQLHRHFMPSWLAQSKTLLTWLALMIFFVTLGLLILFREIWQRLAAQEQLQRQNIQLSQLATVFSHAHEGIMICYPDGEIIDVNDAFCMITGYDRSEVIGQNPRLLKSGHQGQSFYTSLWTSIQSDGFWSGEVFNRRKNGEIYAEHLTITAVKNPAEQIIHYVSLFSDISVQKQQELRLHKLAHFDPLTGLPNRSLLHDRLKQAMLNSVRHRRLLVLVFIDLDGFKRINDDYGHDAGDSLLCFLAEQMSQSIREGDTLARIGGDEFVAVLTDIASLSASEIILQRLLLAASAVHHYKHQHFNVSASLGAVHYPQAETLEPLQLLKQADQAMYLAKMSGKNQYRFYTTDAPHTTD